MTPSGRIPELDRLRDAALARGLLEVVRDKASRVREQLGRPLVLMEVCGTHTMAIARSGLRGLLAGLVELRTGPGCPVCVTDQGHIDQMIELASLPNVTVVTFGDMVRVPGSRTSLERARAGGAMVEVVYSPAAAVDLAATTGGEVVFLGVGFETTAPAVALSVQLAVERQLANYSIYPAHKLVPPVMRALLAMPDLKLDGFILPGHATAIIGRRALDFVGSEFGRPAVVTGFEVAEILDGLRVVLDLVENGRPGVENAYRRVVREEGNLQALAVMERYFAVEDTAWRGVGPVPGSGLGLAPAYRGFDARIRFGLGEPAPGLEKGCRCGDLMKGLINPDECPLFGRTCNPGRPAGPCMVSSEGACAAFYRYERARKGTEAEPIRG
ncbi:MAG: hydrogenase formation protein HypD [Peptococcaceae bacterium]|jgi:hydrogenase expression/formation protein HypD|nr:hydrogenase formation protein HypD [Peptococcaceae bacterium]